MSTQPLIPQQFHPYQVAPRPRRSFPWVVVPLAVSTLVLGGLFAYSTQQTNQVRDTVKSVRLDLAKRTEDMMRAEDDLSAARSQLSAAQQDASQARAQLAQTQRDLAAAHLNQRQLMRCASAALGAATSALQGSYVSDGSVSAACQSAIDGADATLNAPSSSDTTA